MARTREKHRGGKLVALSRAAGMTVIMDRCIYRDYRKECV
jgi:predicted CoA-binding protein